MAIQMIMNTLFDMIKDNISNEDLITLSQKASLGLEENTINTQTFGNMLFAANNSGEMRDYDNELAGIFLRNIGEHGQDLLFLKQKIDRALKDRMEEVLS